MAVMSERVTVRLCGKVAYSIKREAKARGCSLSRVVRDRLAKQVRG